MQRLEAQKKVSTQLKSIARDQLTSFQDESTMVGDMAQRTSIDEESRHDFGDNQNRTIQTQQNSTRTPRQDISQMNKTGGKPFKYIT